MIEILRDASSAEVAVVVAKLAERSAVQIQSSAEFYERHVFAVNCLKYKNKKRPEMTHFSNLSGTRGGVDCWSSKEITNFLL